MRRTEGHIVTRDVVVLGTLAEFDLLLAEHLRRRGLTVRVVRRSWPGASPPYLSPYFTHLRSDDIATAGTPVGLWRLLRHGRLVVCLTGALVNALGPLWFARRLLRLPPLVNVMTGSDITELAAAQTLSGVAYRQYLRFADVNWCVAYPHALKNILRYRVPRLAFMRLPYYLPDRAPAFAPATGRLRFFHPSHLDWKLTDSGAHRNSSKGNDRFLRAFARAVNDGLDAEVVILDRGPDRHLARELTRELGIADRFVWKAAMTRDEFIVECERADVIVDQFDIGGLGGIAVEAMSQQKPVMIYVDETCRRLVYPEPVPVLNCRTEDEIYDQIQRCRNREFVERLGRDARAWTLKYHSWETCLDEFLFRYSQLTGHLVADYGWNGGPN